MSSLLNDQYKLIVNDFSFVRSDPAVKQFLLHLDEKVILGKKFVIDDLDETHLFVSAEIVAVLQEKVWEIMDNNSFNITQSSWWTMFFVRR